MHLCILSLSLGLSKIGELVHSAAMKLQGPGLMLVAIADSSFLSLPEGNDFLIVILSMGNTWRSMVYFVAMTIAGSVCGCVLLYTVGRKGGSPLLRRRFSEKNIERVERLFEKYGVLTVAVPSILPPPCPFKIFVLSAGVFRLRMGEFIAAVSIGRTIRYSMWGILAVLYGNSVKLFMQEHLHQIGIVLFVAFLLILGTLFYHYARWVKRGTD